MEVADHASYHSRDTYIHSFVNDGSCVCGGIFVGDKPAIDSRKIKRASHFSGVI